MPRSSYRQNVFVNCPFDSDYRPVFEALVFAVHDCGFVARCALELDDASEVRIDKIARIIGECRLGIHDISRTEPDPVAGLPRFNMPLELGLFLGAKRYGSGRQKQKLCMILDRDRYRYQRYCSDIAGQDIQAHGADTRRAVRVVRDWLSDAVRAEGTIIPSGTRMAERYDLCRRELPLFCEKLRPERAHLRRPGHGLRRMAKSQPAVISETPPEPYP